MKYNIQTAIKLSVVFFLFFGLLGCAAPAPRKSITELYSPKYHADFDYQPKQQQSNPTGFTVGILDVGFDYDSTTYLINSGVDKQYTNNFRASFFENLEKILMSKGIAVVGPFDSYEEMTYPERKRCDFLIQPKIKLAVDYSVTNPVDLNGYSGPEGQYRSYQKADANLDVSAKMQYVVFDPLTAEKLARHKIKTDQISKSTIELATRMVSTNKKGEVVKEWWEPLYQHKNSYPNYHNGPYLYGEILDNLFDNYMSKVDAILSVEEFSHLKKYIEELERKKRF